MCKILNTLSAVETLRGSALYKSTTDTDSRHDIKTFSPKCMHTVVQLIAMSIQFNVQLKPDFPKCSDQESTTQRQVLNDKRENSQHHHISFKLKNAEAPRVLNDIPCLMCFVKHRRCVCKCRHKTYVQQNDISILVSQQGLT